MSDFFSNLQKLRESTSSFLSEQVQNVQESLSIQAKTAEAEIIKERELIIKENESKKKILEGDNSLPWETKEESLMILSQDLMEQMFTLSLCDDNFIEIPDNELISNIEFDFDRFLPVIFRLLKLDANLAATHAKLSPKMDETLFWRNYYQRLMYLRAKIGMDGEELKNTIGSIPHETIIKRFNKVKVQKDYEKKLPVTTISFSPKNEADGSGSKINKLNINKNHNVNVNVNEIDENEEKTKEKLKEQAALAAEVEAELLGDDLDGLDISDMADMDMGDLPDFDGEDYDLDDLDDLDIDNNNKNNNNNNNNTSGHGDSLLDEEIARELEFGDDLDDLDDLDK